MSPCAHFIKLAKIKNSNNTKCWKNMGKCDLLCNVDASVILYTCLGEHLVMPSADSDQRSVLYFG